MSILITGGAGFIGSHLARYFSAQGEKVILLDIDFNTGRVADIGENVTIAVGNIADMWKVAETIRRHEVRDIFHCGALVSKACEDNPEQAFAVNVRGTKNILESARIFGIGKVMLMSTIGTFGDFVTEPVSNDAAQHPLTLYGVTKVYAERLAAYYHRKYGLDCRGVRFPSVIGPGRFTMSGSAYSTLMIEHAALGKPYRIRVDENSSLPLLYIDDAINALIKLYSAPPERLTRRFYNLGGFVATAGEIREHVRKNIPDSVLDFQPNPEVVNSVAILPKIFDDSKARQDWSWEITYDLPRAVSAFIRAVRENPAFFMATESAPRPIGKP